MRELLLSWTLVTELEFCEPCAYLTSKTSNEGHRQDPNMRLLWLQRSQDVKTITPEAPSTQNCSSLTQKHDGKGRRRHDKQTESGEIIHFTATPTSAAWRDSTPKCEARRRFSRGEEKIEIGEGGQQWNRWLRAYIIIWGSIGDKQSDNAVFT